MGSLRAGAVLVAILDVVVILQACHSCMGLRQVLSTGQSHTHAGSPTLHNSWKSTRSPDQFETSTEDLPADIKVHNEVVAGFTRSVQKWI